MIKEELEVFNKFKDNIKVVFDIGARTDMIYKDVEVHYFEPHAKFVSKLEGGIINGYGLSNKKERLLYNTKTQSFDENGTIFYLLDTLDNYAKDIQVDFIKIDAEGMDYQILQGGKETLKKVKYIQFEYWDGVRKFIDLLPEFDLYLMKEERLFAIIPKELQHKYDDLLTKLDDEVIKLIEEHFIPKGAGGNIFGIKK